MSEWLTRAEVAKRAKLSVALFEKLAVTGGGPPIYKIGKAVRYEWSEVEAWLKSRRIVSTFDAKLRLPQDRSER